MILSYTRGSQNRLYIMWGAAAFLVIWFLGVFWLFCVYVFWLMCFVLGFFVCCCRVFICLGFKSNFSSLILTWEVVQFLQSLFRVLLFGPKNSDLMHYCVQPIPHRLKGLLVATLCTAALPGLSNPRCGSLALVQSLLISYYLMRLAESVRWGKCKKGEFSMDIKNKNNSHGMHSKACMRLECM